MLSTKRVFVYMYNTLVAQKNENTPQWGSKENYCKYMYNNFGPHVPGGPHGANYSFFGDPMQKNSSLPIGDSLQIDDSLPTVK